MKLAYLTFATLLAGASTPTTYAQSAQQDELRGEAWLIQHGILTSKWNSRACRALAMELTDEARMTPERLALARELAEHAGSAHRCNRDSAHPRAEFTL